MDTRAPLSPRSVADTTLVARELPIRHLRGKYVRFQRTNPPRFDALDAAVRLVKRPYRARAMRAAPVPKGVITLFQILSGSDEPTALAVYRLKRDPAYIRSIAARYVDEILLSGDPDHYRILGVPRDAPQEQVDAHLRAALAWLLPYVGTSRWEHEFASAVVAAGRAIGTEDDRIAYDLASWSDMAAAASGLAARRPGWRRPLMFSVVAIAWFGVIDGYFLANGTVETTTFVEPPQTSASTEATPPLDVVPGEMVNGLEASSTATAAPMDLLNGDVATATQTPPDLKTAFPLEAPPSDAGVAATVAAESQSALAAGDPPAATDVVAAVTAREPSADPVVTAGWTENAALAPAAAAVETAAQMTPTATPAEPVENAVKVEVTAPEPEPPAATVAPAATIVVSPSFKCSGVRTDTEIAICDDPILAAKDRELARIFRQVRASLAGSLRASATNLQRDWLKGRNSCSGSKTCILGAYDSRISELAGQLE